PERRHRAPRCVRRGLLPLRPRPAPRATLFPYATRFRSRAAELAREGKVEALMKGSLHTDELMAAVVSSAGGLRTKRRVSHCFVLQTPHYPRPFIVTDAAINLAPDLAQKADIVRNAIELAHVIGVETPKVAILA